MSKLYDVIVLTDRRYVNPSQTGAYEKNIILEDQLVADALKDLGLKVKRLSWDDPVFDWSSAASVLFRTTWDYFDRFNEFSKWLNRISAETTLFNSEKLIRWNLDKHYLNDLSAKGTHTPATLFLEKGTKGNLSSHIKNTGWYDAILKPCVSGSARHTYRVTPENVQSHEKVFSELISQESMMLQPFQRNIVEQGEISLMIFNGEYTHAVLKKAKKGDFRVQDDFGGTVALYEASQKEIAFALTAVEHCPEPPMYARVDIFTDNEGKLAVSELELIEPELWFRLCPEAAPKMAKALYKAL